MTEGEETMRLAGTRNAKTTARHLRQAMTPPELALWQALRRQASAPRFRRRHPAGAFILDFYCAPASLAIEVDGEAHNRGDRPVRDAARTEWLAAQGVEVLRFTATDVLKDLDAVVRQIIAVTHQRIAATLPPTSPSDGR
ncbi:endonuclease domain-containing protein [Sphingomonas qomolangmaensis]|uniref:Endonuclease domain-containing protein n=2 Tax=Sphingomonas qomolangmaensis TaxID=2918765 RepID=A0ABY5LB08_9SPHN|nr:endonuclease domain-containing protein [Sphingomonas qomolangmaensis]